jgi:hypothetical protein
VITISNYRIIKKLIDFNYENERLKIIEVAKYLGEIFLNFCVIDDCNYTKKLMTNNLS